MKEIIKGIASMYNAHIELDYKDGYPPTINHKNQSETVLEAAKLVVGEKAGSPYLSMGGEDFFLLLYKKSQDVSFLWGLLQTNKNYLKRLIIVHILIWMKGLF